MFPCHSQVFIFASSFTTGFSVTSMSSASAALRIWRLKSAAAEGAGTKAAVQDPPAQEPVAAPTADAPSLLGKRSSADFFASGSGGNACEPHSRPPPVPAGAEVPTPALLADALDLDPVRHNHMRRCMTMAAPMVKASDLAFRLLCRRYGADVCFTPMLYASLVAESKVYRDTAFQTTPEDRPLVVQFAGSDKDVLLRAAELVQGQCDAVDLNFGCPLLDGKTRGYGAWMLESKAERRVVLECVRQRYRDVFSGSLWGLHCGDAGRGDLQRR